MTQFTQPHTAGEIIIKHVTVYLCKYISKGAIDVNFSVVFSNNPSNPYKQRNQKQYCKERGENIYYKLSTSRGPLVESWNLL